MYHEIHKVALAHVPPPPKIYPVTQAHEPPRVQYMHGAYIPRENINCMDGILVE